MNQPNAAAMNFEMFLTSLLPLLDAAGKEEAERIRKGHAARSNAMVGAMWARKLGFSPATPLAQSEPLWDALEDLMVAHPTDYTILFRQLVSVAAQGEGGTEGEGGRATAASSSSGGGGGGAGGCGGGTCSMGEEKPAAPPDFSVMTTKQLLAELTTRGIPADGLLEKNDILGALRADNVHSLLAPAFYKPLPPRLAAAWRSWVASWLAALQAAGVTGAEAAATMRSANPKYVPREWMLVDAYTAAEAGNYGPLQELQKLFQAPYDEQPDFEARFYRKAPSGVEKKGGTGFMS